MVAPEVGLIVIVAGLSERGEPIVLTVTNQPRIGVLRFDLRRLTPI
jgi:hypothetical protein